LSQENHANRINIARIMDYIVMEISPP